VTKETMPATGLDELPDDPEGAGPDQLKRLIGGQVLRALGGAPGRAGWKSGRCGRGTTA
jgi:hypothetical protein